MRVLLVNKFYYRRGGDCIAMMNTEALLCERGHEVGVYTMNYPSNVDSANLVGAAPEVHFGGLPDKVRYLWRMMGWDDVPRQFAAALAEFRPDVVHLHNIHSYLSPALARAAHEHGARVVWTMHDYKLICPAYTLLHDGQPCEQCLTNPGAVLRNRCIKQSLAASVAAWAEARRWSLKKLTLWTDAFVCPSEFMATMLRRGGVPADKLHVIPNFMPQASTPPAKKEPVAGRYSYIGRLSPEKGVRTLVAVARELPYDLMIAGDGPLADELRELCDAPSNIHLLGQLDAHKVKELMASSQFTVVPSEWYENNPLSIIESHCAGRPVVAAEIGGIPELIDDHNGILFTASDGDSLRRAITKAMGTHWNHEAIAQQAQDRFSSQRHYEALSHIYHLS